MSFSCCASLTGSTGVGSKKGAGERRWRWVKTGSLSVTTDGTSSVP
jgi:hypothetical protein